MIHIACSKDIPTSVDFRTYVRKPTIQRAALMLESFSVETQHGTMAGRPGDYLTEGTTGQLYVVGGVEFERSYSA